MALIPLGYLTSCEVLERAFKQKNFEFLLRPRNDEESTRQSWWRDVEGSLTLRTWEKNGETRAGLNVAAWKCEKLGAIGRNKSRKQAGHAVEATGRDHQRPLDAEIPF